LLTDFFMVPLVLIPATIAYFRQRNWAKMSWLWCFVPGYIVFINLSFYWVGDGYYLEHMYTPVAVMLALVLVFDLLPHVKTERKTLTILLMIVLARFINIYDSQHQYRVRHEWMHQALQRSAEQGHARVYLPADAVPTATIIDPWGIAYRSLLLSAQQGPEAARTLFVAYPGDDLSRPLAQPNGLQGPFGMYAEDSSLNAVYFRPAPGPYVLLE
jgi:hypothetical protein